MKKILFRTGYLGLGAIEQLAFDIVCNLKNDFEIVLAIENHSNNSLLEKLPKEIKYFHLKSKEYEKNMRETRNKKKNIFYKLKYNYLLKKEKTICCDAINKYIKENNGFDLFVDYDGMAYKYAEKININKKIIWQHTSMDKEKNIRRTEKRLNKYDKIALLCNDMKKDYIEIFPKLKNKFHKIYNFLDLDRIDKMKEDYSDFSEKEKEMLKENYCIKIARLDYPKDFDTLIKAFKILKDRGINEKLYILGEGEQRKDLEKQIKENGLEETIYLMGKKKNPYAFLNSADIFIHSSKREGFGMVLIEAMACEKLVVSSDCMTGPREILENGDAGKLYSVGDFLKLADILEKYLKNPNLKSPYIKKGNKRVLDFEKSKIIKDIQRFFHETIQDKTRR